MRSTSTSRDGAALYWGGGGYESETRQEHMHMAIMSAGPRSRFTMQLIILRADSMGADQRGLSHRQLPNLWHM
jgi:hypothetical protein